MSDTTQDFNRLNAVAQQQAPQHQHHGPSAGTAAVVGLGLWLGARELSYRQAVAEGRLPLGWKRDVRGWYAALAAVIHFVIFLTWYANTFTADDVFWPMVLVTGLVVWAPVTLFALAHQDRVNRHNQYLLDQQN